MNKRHRRHNSGTCKLEPRVECLRKFTFINLLAPVNEYSFELLIDNL